MKLMARFLKPYIPLLLAVAALFIADCVGGLFIPTLAAQMLNLGTAGASFDLIIKTGIQMALLSAVSGGCGVLGGYLCAVLSSNVGKDIRKTLYEKTLSLSIYDFRQFGAASVTTRTSADVNTIQFELTSVMSMLMPVPVICIVALILTFRLDMRMGFILLAVVGAVMAIAGVIMHSASPLFRKLQRLLDKMSAVLLENLTGVRVVRAFNSEVREKERMSEAFSEYAATSIRANRKFACLDGLSFFCINFFTVLVYWMSGPQISLGRFQIGDITALIEYSLMVMFFLMMAQMEILMLPRAIECCNRISAILSHSPEIKDLVTENPADNHTDDVLTFENVSFRFADAEENTLNKLNFSCRRGETTAVIGGTGSGKSTVASLIMRFNEVRDGCVRLNGVNIRRMPQKFLRDHLAYVQQKAWLFSGTVAENLRYGKKDASDAELWHALKIAQADDFIRQLPEGLNAPVAQGGTNFSGGQRQRLSIARALVKKPELYIFDDSFSALDFKTDAALRKALANETKDAAVLIIAQRISTIRHAERIVVLNDGSQAGIGTHEELLENCPIYREIYLSQTKEDTV